MTGALSWGQGSNPRGRAGELSPGERRQLNTAVAVALGLKPRQLRLISAVHEAGHAIVAATLGFRVTGVRIAGKNAGDDPGRILEGPSRTAIDFGAYPGRVIPLPDLLAVRAAGFQATYSWLDGRGVDPAAEPYICALNTLAGGDIYWYFETCDDLGKQDLSMQDGIGGAARILWYRWHAVLSLAYALAARRIIRHAELQPYLTAGALSYLKGAQSYWDWRDQNAELWQPVTSRGMAC